MGYEALAWCRDNYMSQMPNLYIAVLAFHMFRTS